jgi:uncharacterized membrane protein
VFFNPVGALSQKKVNNRLVVVIGTIVTCAGVFTSSYMTSLFGFIFFYACIFGIGIGITYFTPLVCGWEWFPG